MLKTLRTTIIMKHRVFILVLLVDFIPIYSSLILNPYLLTEFYVQYHYPLNKC